MLSDEDDDGGGGHAPPTASNGVADEMLGASSEQSTAAAAPVVLKKSARRVPTDGGAATVKRRKKSIAVVVAPADDADETTTTTTTTTTADDAIHAPRAPKKTRPPTDVLSHLSSPRRNVVSRELSYDDDITDAGAASPPTTDGTANMESLVDDDAWRVFACVNHPGPESFARSTVIYAESRAAAAELAVETFKTTSCVLHEIDRALPAAYWLHKNEFFGNYDSHRPTPAVAAFITAATPAPPMLRLFSARSFTFAPRGLSILIVAYDTAQAYNLMWQLIERTRALNDTRFTALYEALSHKSFTLYSYTASRARSAAGVYQLSYSQGPAAF